MMVFGKWEYFLKEKQACEFSSVYTDSVLTADQILC